MGFDVFGAGRHVRVSNLDGGEPRYDILAMPSEFGLSCPQLAKLHQRFYHTTLICFGNGDVDGLRDELIQLRDAYRAKREPELIKEHGIHARDPHVRRAILEQVFQHDAISRVIDQFRLLCDESIAAEVDVRCVGD